MLNLFISSNLFLLDNSGMLYIIIGPTCSGKTSAACELSDYLNKAKIINLDAFQIYKDMDIGTAKLKKDDKYYDRHLLLDIKSPEETYSIKEFQETFRKVLEDNKNEENLVAVGGSGLYLAAGLYDYHFDEEDEPDTSDLDELDNEKLYDILTKLDPKAAEGIHPNNRKRVLRAIVIARSGNKLKSENAMEVKHTPYIDKNTYKIFFINPNREELYKRINERVDQMIKDGLIEEVKGLLKKYKLSLTASQAIGYKEIISYLNGEMSKEDAVELIKKRTRNYAKRQVTFFKHQFDTIEVKDYKEILGIIKDER